MPSSDAGFYRPPLKEPLRPDASCDVVIETPELLPGTHVPEGTPITYDSNPPSSGPHYPIWANFQEYDTPVELPYLVHSLEHGAIVFFYKPCTDGDAATSTDDAEATSDAGVLSGSCKATVEGFRAIRDAMPSDPLCDPSIRVRVVIVPDPALDVPVAAAAWGWTYKAQCFDRPTLEAFAREHYRQGPEDLCAPGRTF